MSALLVLVLLAAPAAEPTSEAELIRRGVAEREQGRDQMALELFRQAYDRYHTPRAQAQMGLASLLSTCPEVKLRDPGRAVALAQKAVALAPNLAEARSVLARLYLDSGQTREAIEQWQQTIKPKIPKGEIPRRMPPGNWRG